MENFANLTLVTDDKQKFSQTEIDNALKLLKGKGGDIKNGPNQVSFHANWAKFSKLAADAGIDAATWNEVTPIAKSANEILKKAVKEQKSLSEDDIKKIRKDFGTDSLVMAAPPVSQEPAWVRFIRYLDSAGPRRPTMEERSLKWSRHEK